ncbi:MAG: tetratricopeptide repeat protein [Steroidobacterales bacterium]
MHSKPTAHDAATMKAATLNPGEIGTLIALVNQDRLGEAEQRSRALLEVHPNAGMLWKILGVALGRQGKDALPALRRTAELMPQDAEAHGNLGAALHDHRQWSEALVSLRRALEIRPTDVDAMLNAADSLRELGRVREAVPLYQRALQMSPRQLVAQNDLGNALLQLGQHEEALASYRRALTLQPHDAQIHYNLGNALRLLVRYEEALAVSRQAIALDPTLSVAHTNAGLSLVGLGRRDEAVLSFRQALALGPVGVEVLNNLGNTLRDIGARQEAADLYRRAIQLDPTHVESYCNLGNMLFQLRQVDDSAAVYRQAIALKPDHAPAHVSLSIVLRQQRRAAEAQASCQVALGIDPGFAEALHVLGELRADRGEFADAEQLFRRAIALKPDFTAAYNSIATHRKMTRDDTDWLQGVQGLLATRLPLEQEIGLRYSLGKYLDDVCEYDEAFAQYRHANELTKRYGATYHAQRLTARVDAIISRFDAAFVNRHREGASTSDLPVLIIGMPRSGTSLIEQILASHPAAYGAGEVTFWNAAYNAWQDAGFDSQAGAGLIPRIARDYLERLTAGSGAALRIVDKLPANFMHAGLIHVALPRARIIHVRRHPIDTCLSIYFQNFFNMGPHANDLDSLAHYYREYRRVTDHWRAVLPAATLLEVPYEALIGDQEGWTRRMLEFIGLPWDPKCLDFHKTDRVVLTASKWQVRQKIHSASAGRWRHYEKFIGPLRSLVD